MSEIISSLFSNCIKYFSGWIFSGFIFFLIKTKTGNTILSWLKHCWYLIINPAIRYSASFSFYFDEDVSESDLKDLISKIYNNPLIDKYKLNREGLNDLYCKFYYAGINYLLEIDKNDADDKINVYLKLKETESNYKNLRKHLNCDSIKGFVKDVVLSEIQHKYTSNDFRGIYEIKLYFTEQKYNFFVTGRLEKIPKGLIDSISVIIKDDKKDNWNIYANTESIKIIVENDIEDFFDSIKKYLSIL